MKAIFSLLFLFIIGNLFGQSAKVVGYLPTYRFSNSNQIEYCKLTHLNICFANPDAAGNIIMPDITSIKTDALNDNPNIKICISLAGGVLTSQQATNWSNLIDNAANRPAFITKIVNYVLANNLNGVDVDLEWDNVTTGYSSFVTELDVALSVHNKILTAALPNQTLFANITPAAIAAFDFVNIMSYDETGPWAPNSPGQHSSYNFAQNGINFWKNTVGIAGNKLMLGVPFYGYDFVNATTVNSLSFSEIIALNSANSNLDNVGNLYYNGIPTIQNKVALANTQAGGIMIWELGQEAYNQYSLLSTIHNKYTNLGITTTGLCGNTLSTNQFELENIEIYPNPVSDFLIIKTNEEINKVELYSILGKKIKIELQNNSIDLSKLSTGNYFLHIETTKGKLIKQIIKN